jgi:NAD-dependent deacetylase
MPLSERDRRQVEAAAALVRRADSVLFITGAGISADSGLPTYRGVGGLYEDRSTDDGVPIEVALSGPFFRRRPEITWKYLLQIERACRAASFNRGHEVVAQLERRLPRVWTFTQNVDGLHRAAGARNVIDIHGDLHRLRCTGCDAGRTVADYSGLPDLPTCERCGSIVRPDVVLFEEMLPLDKFEQFRREFDRGFDVVFSVGTSSLFPYIVEPVYRAREMGVPTVEINPGETEVSGLVDHRIRAGAAESLDALWTAVASPAPD